MLVRCALFCKTSSAPLLSSKFTYIQAFHSKQFYNFASRKQENQNESQQPEIIEDEQLISSQFIRPKTFKERNKITLGLFGTGIISKIVGYKLFGSWILLASFISLWRAERLGLKIRKLYEDVKGLNSQKYENLNALLKETMLKHDELGQYLNRETLCFSNFLLQRRSHSENRMYKDNSYEAIQKRYNYSLLFFDVGTGAEGKITSQCVYNYDTDYYFRVIHIYLIEPRQEMYKIEDNRDTIDI